MVAFGQASVDDDERGMSAARAAARLGVKPATLYAYVSRGLLRSRRAADGRTSTFDPAEVEALALRGRRAAPPATPGLMVRSTLTSISDDGHAYRGLAATALVRERTFEEVAEWLWTGEFPGRAIWRPDPMALVTATAAQASLPSSTKPVDRLPMIVAATAAVSDESSDRQPSSLASAARSLLATMVSALPPLRPDLAGPLELGGAQAPAGALAAKLWVRLCPASPSPGMLDTLNAAMILLADHELSASTLAARIAASVHAGPHAVVGTGLGVVSGALHGGASLAAEDLLAEVGQPDHADGLVGARLRRNERVPGFGHALYRTGDPRAPFLLNLLRERSRPEQLATVEAVLESMLERGLPPPNVDFAVAAFTRAAGMVRGAGEAIFAVARTAGWLAHAVEEYRRPTVFRPRAVHD
jgi:citrate synthase